MRVFIIEDEAIAQSSLIRMLTANFSDMEIVGTAGSVKDAVTWLQDEGNAADVIFMDVELSDGNCFEIFRQTKVGPKVIMTTAYDNYAVKAFEINSVDYLLKPIDLTALKRAVARCREASGSHADFDALLAAIKKPSDESRKRIIVRCNDTIVPVQVDRIAYFYAEEKVNWIVTDEGRQYILDSSLDVLSEELDKDKFFRISRSCIVALSAIDSITKQMGGRLKVTARPKPDFEMTVSRSRVDDFIAWLER